MADQVPTRTARKRAFRRLFPLQLSLLVLWVFLWGSFSPSVILTGAIFATLIPMVFYLPPIESTGRFHLGWAVVFVVRLLADIVRASIIVAGQAVGIGYSKKSAVIRVPLRTRSDLIMTATAEASTLVPGTVVIDVDREDRDLFLHVFSVRSKEDVVKARRHALELEARIIMAIGSEHEVRRLRLERKRQQQRKGGGA